MTIRKKRRAKKVSKKKQLHIRKLKKTTVKRKVKQKNAL